MCIQLVDQGEEVQEAENKLLFLHYLKSSQYKG